MQSVIEQMRTEADRLGIKYQPQNLQIDRVSIKTGIPELDWALFEIPKGSVVMFCAETGGGKTMLAKLIEKNNQNGKVCDDDLAMNYRYMRYHKNYDWFALFEGINRSGLAMQGSLTASPKIRSADYVFMLQRTNVPGIIKITQVKSRTKSKCPPFVVYCDKDGMKPII